MELVHDLLVGVLVQNLRPSTHSVFNQARCFIFFLKLILSSTTTTSTKLKLIATFKGLFYFQELIPRNGFEQEWEGKWGRVTKSIYQLNLDFLEHLISTERFIFFHFFFLSISKYLIIIGFVKNLKLVMF